MPGKTKITDWKITRGRTGYHLHHMDEPCKAITMRLKGKRMQGSNPFYGWYCYKKNGYWHCPCCRAVAPPDIAFLAELADCPKSHNEFVERTERHERLVKQRLL